MLGRIHHLMRRFFGTRTLAAICVAMMLLLAALAAIQYRWSTRVAAADAQREREHLESAATLFANEFTGSVGKAVAFMQDDAWSAKQSHHQIATVPKLIAELYYVEFPITREAAVQRLGADGYFAPAVLPSWFPVSRCVSFTVDTPPAVIAPVYDLSTARTSEATGGRVSVTLREQAGRCFVARLDEAYLRDTLFPELIRHSFGETTAREYDFAVVPRSRPQEVLYGVALRADLQKSFFSSEFALPTAKPGTLFPALGRTQIVIQHTESKGSTNTPAGIAEHLDSGLWQLKIAHKGVPLAAAFERTRRRDLLLSVTVEVLLIAAIAVVVIGAARMTRLANQKMQFVAAVSHELRTPVSAISMLSRNQADGLVTGADRVRQYGELIHQQSRRLNEMVERALQYAGIHSRLPRPTKKEVDLRHVIEQVIEARREELARAGVHVQVALDPDLPAIAGDASLLRTAFDNLLSNAQKYGDRGRWIRVSAVYSSAEKEVQVHVEDRGPGIATEDQAAIFEPFCRGQAATDAQIPGSGLGLSLARSAAEVHGGTITLLSEPGRGSTFTMHLPV